MKQIRRSVFETNSSSVHSICITKGKEVYQFPEKLLFTEGDFGWDEAVYTDMNSKASYLYQAIIDCCERKERNEFLRWIMDTLYKYNVKAEFAAITNEYCYGIDHAGELHDFLKAIHNEKRLIRFLFSNNSFIVTGNDNSSTYPEVKVLGDYEEFEKGN